MSWDRFKKYSVNVDSLNISLDFSRISFEEDFFVSMKEKMDKSFALMKDLEAGSIANVDENRMVGHYWLRNAELAPTAELQEEISSNVTNIKAFAKKIHEGEIVAENGEKFENLLCVGIGGSALGPQFVADALGSVKADKLKVFFMDNTDPDGFDVIFDKLEGALSKTLVLIASKSGSTPEPKNAMTEAMNAYKQAGLNFAKHAVATTGTGSNLYNIAIAEGFLATFPMWDWVGGRTSELAGVGLLPAALQGIDIDSFLEGAKLMDIATRKECMKCNPAAMLALAWYYCTDGKGKKDMVILPYKDRLLLASRYLQQLIMESLGKEFDLDGNVVEQGLSVYGNKGSTDQHAFVQQLRDGIDNFFVSFIEVLQDRKGERFEVENKISSGDYLHAFFLGTREALSAKSRENLTITLPNVSPKSVGALIALYERTTSIYANLININAYHQPGVEAGKKAAGSILEIKQKLIEFLEKNQGEFTADEISLNLGLEKDTEIVFKLMLHLASNVARGIKISQGTGFEQKFTIK
ncbi:MAG: glucose-6-phosphate isomerase [Opitutales bacterium]